MLDAQTIIGGVAVVVAGAGVMGIFRMSHQLAILTARVDAHLEHNGEEHRRLREELRVSERRLVERFNSGIRQVTKHAG